MNSPSPAHVLVVEDNDASAEDYRAWLEESGMRVTRARARSEALEHIDGPRADVVLLDLQLPSAPGRADEDVKHGLDVLVRLTQADPFWPVVVVTAHSRDRELMRDVLQRTRGGQFVFKDAPALESDLRAAIAVALAHPAYSMSRAIRQFRSMLDQDLPENDYRKFIADHWKVLLGPEYKACRSPHTIAAGAEADLFAVRHDDFPDLWELKRPKDPLYARYNDWFTHSKETAAAVGQIIDYCDIVRRNTQVTRGYEERKGLGIVHLHRPRGFVVIGRYTGDPAHRKATRDRLRLENSYYAGLTLMTYDDLVERAEQYLTFLHEYRPHPESS